jgi:hypothetical protein
MTTVAKGEETIYTVRPKILDIINSYIKQQEESNSDSNPNPGLDLKAGVSRNSLMSFKKDKANLLYMEKVMPLELTIKQISTNLLPGKDILLDLILDPINSQVSTWITKIQSEIDEDDGVIKAEPIFNNGKVIKLNNAPSTKTLVTSSSSSSIAPIAVGGLTPSSSSSSSSTIAMGGLSPTSSSSSSSSSGSSSGTLFGGGKRNKTRRVQDSGKTEYKIRFV